MIEYIKGEIVELTPARMILECAGIGYELNISLNTYTFYNGKPTGKIYVYEVIREDAHLLFGFAGKDEMCIRDRHYTMFLILPMIVLYGMWGIRRMVIKY